MTRPIVPLRCDGTVTKRPLVGTRGQSPTTHCCRGRNNEERRITSPHALGSTGACEFLCLSLQQKAV